MVNDEPKITIYDSLFDAKTCQHFIEIGKPKMERALVSFGKKGGLSKGRTGQNCWIQHDQDEVTLKVAKQIANIVGLPLENAESFQVIYYDQSQEYRRHYDGWRHDKSEKTLRCMKRGGQRLVTALCYLNDVKKGGGTNFPQLNLTVEAKQGRLVTFHNVKKGTHELHDDAEHAGMPVVDGEKYAFNLWFRESSMKKVYKEVNPSYYASPLQPAS